MGKIERHAAIIAFALLSTAIVAAVAFSGSWQHQYELTVRYGQAHWVAGMQPLSVEGLVVAATLMLWFAAMLKRQRRQVWPAYVALLAGVGQAALMNVASDHDYNWVWLGPEIAVWPAIAFVASYEMAVWMMRNRPPRSASPTPQPAPEPATFTEGDSAAGTGAKPVSDLLDEVRRSAAEYDALPQAARPVVVPPLVRIDAVNGSGKLPHTCGGPKGGKLTPGCPRCDELLAAKAKR